MEGKQNDSHFLIFGLPVEIAKLKLALFTCQKNDIFIYIISSSHMAKDNDEAKEKRDIHGG